MGEKKARSPDKRPAPLGGPTTHDAAVWFVDRCLRRLLADRMAPPMAAWGGSAEDYAAALDLVRAEVTRRGRKEGWLFCIKVAMGFAELAMPLKEEITSVAAQAGRATPEFTTTDMFRRISVKMIAVNATSLAAKGDAVWLELGERRLDLLDVGRRIAFHQSTFQPAAEREQIQRTLAARPRPTELWASRDQSSHTAKLIRDDAERRGFPRQWRLLLEIPDPATLPDPLQPFFGEPPPERSPVPGGTEPEAKAAVTKHASRTPQAVEEEPLTIPNSGDWRKALSESERKDLHAFEQSMLGAFFFEVGGVRLNDQSTIADYQRAVARQATGHRLSALSDEGAATSAGPASHPAPRALLDLLRFLIVARANPAAEGPPPTWAEWWPTREDFAAVIHMLRNAVTRRGSVASAWDFCIDAVTGYVESFTGRGTVEVTLLTTEAVAFAAVGAAVRRGLEPSRQALLARARALCDDDGVFGNDIEDRLPSDLEILAAVGIDRILDDVGFPVEWRPLLRLPPSADLPDPREPYIGEQVADHTVLLNPQSSAGAATAVAQSSAEPATTQAGTETKGDLLRTHPRSRKRLKAAQKGPVRAKDLPKFFGKLFHLSRVPDSTARSWRKKLTQLDVISPQENGAISARDSRLLLNMTPPKRRELKARLGVGAIGRRPVEARNKVPDDLQDLEDDDQV